MGYSPWGNKSQTCQTESEQNVMNVPKSRKCFLLVQSNYWVSLCRNLE